VWWDSVDGGKVRDSEVERMFDLAWRTMKAVRKRAVSLAAQPASGDISLQVRADL